MTIQIGASQYQTRRPVDLDADAAAATGCSVGEVKAMLAGQPLAGFVARILALFLDEPPPLPELATEIAAAGTFVVAADVAALLDAPEEPAE